ncbi:hypothetical protein ACLEWV_26585, partial [Escherichia coli]
PQNDVTLKMPAFEWVHVQLHQQKGMISLSPPTICNSAYLDVLEYTGHYLLNFVRNDNGSGTGIHDYEQHDHDRSHV